ncbi:hypothetical protein PESP_b0558 [Pseudoalteromonas espejiana DSM 9414]|uniref:Uncharacterized protein n=1 Tax=Pseudoalteromonas espejiana TaxID=28107 RepID=A0A510Y094_9GAMM|nr:hypothetical protein [Pseudoalteromonas espejiana]ASM52101.1 hypothetical protein PESP_b0558 [Pseudoalteromonas espejiana DSM 9414]GEK56752.1 hypothetical protein PES01_35970 [Pseudoalteromonas espejiana]
MLNIDTTLSVSSLNKLQIRDLNETEISGFADILKQANEDTNTPKAFLKSLTTDELQLVKKANSLASTINVDSLSAEGAQNLLSQPDGSDLVDLNNDGIVEIGESRSIHFPPVNAPLHVKTAWNKATEGLDWAEKASIELTLHSMVYGFNINGSGTKDALAPQEQCNKTNIDALSEYAYSNLEFRVNLEGWSDYNKQLNDVYDKFFTSVLQHNTNASLSEFDASK